MIGNLAWEVARTIPTEHVAGLLTGVYKLHGGVLRDGAGRIVAHLALPEAAASAAMSMVPGLDVISSLMTAGQVVALGRSVEQVRQSLETVLTVSVTGAALSGMGLVTSLGGFAYLSRRLKILDDKLSRLERGIKEIEFLIKCQQKAQLYEALDTLFQTEHMGAKRHRLRRDLLLQCKETFGTLAHFYREIWAKASIPEVADGADEFYALSFTGAAYAASELGMGAEAWDVLAKHFASWSELARQHAKKQLVGGDLSRLLDADLVEVLPAAELVLLLDFAHDEEKGVSWFDDLLRAPIPITRRIPVPIPRRPKKDSSFIEMPRRLHARHQVLDSTVVHFEALSRSELTVSQFGGVVNDAFVQSDNEPFMLVLSGSQTSRA